MAALLRGDGGAVRGAARARRRRAATTSTSRSRSRATVWSPSTTSCRPIRSRAGRWRSSTTRSAIGVTAPRQAARVRPYSAAELARAAPTIGRVATAAARRTARAAPPARRRARSRSTATHGRPGHAVGHDGRRAARRRRASASCASRRRERAPQKLRSTRLTIAFDGEDDRRRAADRLLRDRAGLEHLHLAADARSRPTDVLICRFRMPFAKRAGRDDRAPRSGRRSTSRAPSTWPPRRSGRTACCSTRAGAPREVVRTRPFRDWHVAGIEGAGAPGGDAAERREPARRGLVGRRRREDLRRRRGVPRACSAPAPRTTSATPGRRTERFEHAYHAQTATAGAAASAACTR